MTKKPENRKYDYRLVIQFLYDGSGYGWEDVVDYDATDREERRNARHDFTEYLRSSTDRKGHYRMIKRRVLKEEI